MSTLHFYSNLDVVSPYCPATEHHAEVEPAASSFPDLLGDSPAMNGIRNFINRAAQGKSTVLIQGETGTGKELVAKAIHHRSMRGNGPFVAVNCATLTEHLLESELFGYERGAFTGAFGRSKGLIEYTNGGTFFLDELGELASAIQPKLLRMFDEQWITRLGGRGKIAIDVRFIAATNKHLQQEVEAGRFRQDLYHRLNVVSAILPPLRERKGDIPLLAQHFLRKSCKKIGRDVKGLSAAVQQLFHQYSWPGNVRELANAIERAVLLGSTAEIVLDDLPELLSFATHAAEIRQYRQSLNYCRRESIQMAIENSRGNLTLAAKSLGVHRNYLYRLMKNLDIRQPEARRPLKSA